MFQLFKKKSSLDEDELLKELGLLEHIDDVSSEKTSDNNVKFHYLLNNVVQKATANHHTFAVVGYVLLGCCLLFGAGGNVLLNASIKNAEAMVEKLNQQEAEINQKIQVIKDEMVDYKDVSNKKHVDAIEEDRIKVAHFFVEIQNHLKNLEKNNVVGVIQEYTYNQNDRSVLLKGYTRSFDEYSQIISLIEEKTDYFADFEFISASKEKIGEQKIIPLNLKFYLQSTALTHQQETETLQTETNNFNSSSQ